MANEVAASTPISHADLFGEGATFTVDFDKIKLDEDEEELTNENIVSNLCELMQEEELYNGQDSFEDIATKMTNLTPNGEIKKFIIRQGTGDKLTESVEVSIHYNAFLEYDIDPFDSTYARKRPTRFVLNNGSVIPGLDIAVQSMRLSEKAQFLIAPSFAYGKMGCCYRIPPNATILFEVELISVQSVISEATLEEKNTFENVCIFCENLNAKGKEFFERKRYTDAIRKYNMAREKLESFHVKDYIEQEKQQELLLKFYTNLLICYMKLEKYSQGCSYANKIYRMALGSQLKVPVKVYYNDARCLRKLGDYRMALKRLKEAKRLAPQDSNIAKELIELQEDEKNALEEEATFAARSLRTNQDTVNSKFKDFVKKSCEQLMDKDVLQVTLGGDLSDDEKKFAENESAKFGFQFKTVNKQGKDQSIIIKKTDDNM